MEPNKLYKSYQMETIEPLDFSEFPIAEEVTTGKYESIGNKIGKLVDEKNQAYGDSFNKSGEFLKLLFPNGVQPNQYSDMLGIIRVFDKLMRIASNKGAFKENPWEDICGYSILRSEENN
jgi:hypothetical protein